MKCTTTGPVVPHMETDLLSRQQALASRHPEAALSDETHAGISEESAEMGGDPDEAIHEAQLALDRGEYEAAESTHC